MFERVEAQSPVVEKIFDLSRSDIPGVYELTFYDMQQHCYWKTRLNEVLINQLQNEINDKHPRKDVEKDKEYSDIAAKIDVIQLNESIHQKDEVIYHLLETIKILTDNEDA